MSDVTELLDLIQAGDRVAAEKLLPVVYDELRRLARQKLAREKPGQTLDGTALVHEAYMRLVGGPSNSTAQDRIWDGRGHFFAAAAEAMRRIMVESARRKRGPKCGGDHLRVDIELDAVVALPADVSLIELDEALSRLAAESPIRAELVKLRFFAGLTMPEVAKALDISLATAERYWTYARAWLYAELKQDA